MKNPGAAIFIKAICDLAKAIRKERYPKYPAHMNNKIKRKTGSANMIAAKPLITAMLTALWPTHQPNIYFKPCCQPNAAPVPASDKTPGPGVMQRYG